MYVKKKFSIHWIEEWICSIIDSGNVNESSIDIPLKNKSNECIENNQYENLTLIQDHIPPYE